MKVERIHTEIEKTKAKIGELQTRLRELERQRTEAENTEIVALVRSIELTPAELTEFIKSFRESGQPPAFAATDGYQPEDDQEDTDNEE